jgi:hypothetical protein
MLQLVQLHLVVIVNVTIASTHKEHQLGRIRNIVLPSFETGFYKSYTRGVDYIGLNRPITPMTYHMSWRVRAFTDKQYLSTMLT